MLQSRVPARTNECKWVCMSQGQDQDNRVKVGESKRARKVQASKTERGNKQGAWTGSKRGPARDGNEAGTMAGTTMSMSETQSVRTSTSMNTGGRDEVRQKWQHDTSTTRMRMVHGGTWGWDWRGWDDQCGYRRGRDRGPHLTTFRPSSPISILALSPPLTSILILILFLLIHI
jgi:hypothetical protein